MAQGQRAAAPRLFGESVIIGFWTPVGIDEELFDAHPEQMIKGVRDQRSVPDGDERLGPPRGERAQPRAQTGAKNKRVCGGGGVDQGPRGANQKNDGCRRWRIAQDEHMKVASVSIFASRHGVCWLRAGSLYATPLAAFLCQPRIPPPHLNPIARPCAAAWKRPKGIASSDCPDLLKISASSCLRNFVASLF